MGVDLGAVPVQTPALAGTRPLGLGSELPRRHQERVQRSILGSPRPNSGCRPPALLEAEPQVGQGRRKALSSSSSEK